ncbi:hypothetical protein E4T56_gene13057 [Termitomyces sp. T112]|nr:hypothetical protein E4T56_gene13057 [Termitomyces sp. T112]
MPSRMTLTPMDVLIGPQATSLPALSIASLGSRSVMIQIRTFDHIPTQPGETSGPSSLLARGVVLTLTYVAGPSRVKRRAQAPVVAPAPTVILAPAPAPAVAPSFLLAPSHPHPLSRQPALIRSTPEPRVSLRQLQIQQVFHCGRPTPKPRPNFLQHLSNSSPSRSIWFLLCIISMYFIAFR